MQKGEEYDTFSKNSRYEYLDFVLTYKSLDYAKYWSIVKIVKWATSVTS